MATIAQAALMPRAVEASPGVPASGSDLSGLVAGFARTEFKAPVDAVVGLVTLLVEDCRADEGSALWDDLRRLSAAAQKLDAIVSELLEPARSGQHLQAQDVEAYSSHLRHELRTPITSLLGYGELLVEDLGCRMQPQIEILNDILDAARAMLGQIDAMVEFIRVARDGGAVTHEALADKSHTLAEPFAAIQSVLAEPAAVRPRSVGRVLVVDDNGSTRDLVSRLLSRQGHAITAVDGGGPALERLAADTFDLAVVDLLMPGLSGIDLMREVKAQPRTADLPVIIISALDEVSSTVRCIEAGADDYLTKPINPVMLQARVSAALERKFLRDRDRAITEQLRLEQDRSESLLRNILPLSVIERLHGGETVIADSFAEATILFSDLVNFTAVTAEMPAELVLELLNGIFSAFDKLAAGHGLEKIKTIGDAYMVAGGLPEPRPDHAVAVAHMAMEMPAVVDEVSRRYGRPLGIRIGLHTGPVAAGIIGKNKFIYDVWGDTVNVASRMEHHGEPNRVHVTAETRAALGDAYAVEPRAPIDVKGRGRMTTFLLVGERR